MKAGKSRNTFPQASHFRILFATNVYTTTFFSVFYPFLVVLLVALGLHLLGHLLILSSPRRSRYLYSRTPWLPLRSSPQVLEGEEVEFTTTGKLTLRGTFLASPNGQSKGTVLFCHELNGNRSSITPYVRDLLDCGFDILSFDFRNHGRSDSTCFSQPTPWITVADMDDVKSALNYLKTRRNVENDRIGVFGLGKGATVALCLAGCDSSVSSVVLDTPMPENRLFVKNCWQALVKSTKISRRSTSKFTALFFKALLYALSCPVLTLVSAWRRFVLGLWYRCRFVNPWSMVKNVSQPIMIVHGHVDTPTKPEQIQAFCDRMPTRPKLWLIPSGQRELSENCCRQVARFFEEIV